MKQKLYWVETPDHCEDWFIVAPDPFEAERIREELEGYEKGDAWAEQVVEIPGTLNAEPGWPPEELLLAIGAKFKENGAAWVVEIGSRTFCEGLLEETIRSFDDDHFEEQGFGRINATQKVSKSRQ